MPCPICSGKTAQEAAKMHSPTGYVHKAMFLQVKEQRDELARLLDCINNGTDCDVTGINGDKIDGILLTREFVARVNKFLQTTNSATGAQE